MGLADFVRGIFGRTETRAGYSLRDPALVALFGGHESDAGVTVTEQNVLHSSPVWSAVRVISEGVASLPLILYKRDESHKSRANGHPLYTLLHDNPNPFTPSLAFREALQAHALLWGNAYAEIERNSLGQAVALWILRPDWVQVELQEDGTPSYLYRHPNREVQELDWRDVFHLRGLGYDGLVGYSVVKCARDSLGLTIATERFGAKLFGNGARPSGVLTVAGHLSDDAVARLRKDFNAMHSGVANAHRVAILEQGMAWQSIGIPPEDAQFLQTRSFQIAEVARWFNLPPSKLRDTAGASYSSLEAANMEFLVDTLRPWLIRWEQEISMKLLAKWERPDYHAEHLVEGILRADQASRYNAYAVGRNWGWLSVNQIRAMENMDPIPGGDEFLQPLNMQPIQAPLGPSAPTATPAVGVAPQPPSPPAPAAGVSIGTDPEENDLPAVSEATKRLAEAMTEHQIPACEHGSTNRCRICGIQKERELVPPMKPGGDHSWRFKWVPIELGV
jgi:HK97 family phage portal protein